MTETLTDVAARVKRQAEAIFLDFTAQGDRRLAAMKRTSTYQAEKVAQLAGLVMELADALSAQEERPVPEEGPTREELRAASQAMRDRAAELFSDRLMYSTAKDEWFEKYTGRTVVFTPYGWQMLADAYGTEDYDVYVR